MSKKNKKSGKQTLKVPHVKEAALVPHHSLQRASLTPAHVERMVRQAFFAAAQDSPTMDFSFARDVGINDMLIEDLQKMRTRCRYELNNNGLAKGHAKLYANCVVERGPRLKILGSDETQEWRRLVEKAFIQWSANCDLLGGCLGSMLHFGVRQFFACGEYFKVARIVKDPMSLIKIRWNFIRPDRLTNPTDGQGKNIRQGVEVDDDGRPVAYYIKHLDSDITKDPSDRIDRILADRVIHVFVREEPGQVRGLPWMHTNLPIFHKLRTYDSAHIAAAVIAAKFAAFLVQKDSAHLGPDLQTVMESDYLDIHDGTLSILPPGYAPMQLDPKQPNINASEFRRDQLAIAGAPNSIPANMATFDSSRANFASARFDGITLNQEAEVIRQCIEDRDLYPTFELWRREAEAVGLIPVLPMRNGFPIPYSLDWRWHKDQRHTDPTKEANAQSVLLANGLVTVGELQAEAGHDEDEKFDDTVSEVKRWDAAGLLHPLRKAQPATVENLVNAPKGYEEEDEEEDLDD